MLEEFALVGAMPKKEKPYWVLEAKKIAQRIPMFEKPLISDWERVVRTTKINGIREANIRLNKIIKNFKFGDFRIDQTDDQVVNDYANAKSYQCVKLLGGWATGSDTEEEAAHKVSGLLAHHGMHFSWDKIIKKGLAAGLFLRFQDVAWWRRRIRKVAAQRIEAISRELGFVSRARAIYCSDIGQKEFKRRKQLNLNMLENTVLENEVGDKYTLADLAAVSNANPVIRRTELMVRIAGFEQYAKEIGWEGWFYTITCPSKYHAAHQFGGRNDKFKGYTQRDAQNYLNKLWQRFRAKANREGWQFFGFRVAEPHHDGTPHWHLLMFINPEHANEFGGVLRNYAMKEDGTEAGAFNARFKAEKIKTGINPATGNEYSAAGYIAKYISKNIDGEHIDADLYGEDAKASAANICAWASRNSIRQFQQIGGPSVTGWRELRRLGSLSKEELAMQPFVIREAVAELERLNEESAASAWAWYCRFSNEIGGIKIWSIIKTAQEILEVIDEDTGEILEYTQERVRFNAYREVAEKTNGIRVMGLGQGVYVQTRFHEWKRVDATKEEAFEIRQQHSTARAARAAAAVLRRAERDAKGASAPPWTGVNNCTGDLPERLLGTDTDTKQIALIH